MLKGNHFFDDTAVRRGVFMPITERQLIGAIRKEFAQQLLDDGYSKESRAELQKLLEQAIVNALMRFLPV